MDENKNLGNLNNNENANNVNPGNENQENPYYNPYFQNEDLNMENNNLVTDQNQGVQEPEEAFNLFDLSNVEETADTNVVTNQILSGGNEMQNNMEVNEVPDVSEQNVIDNNMNYSEQGNVEYQDPMAQNVVDNNMNYQDQGNMGYQDPMAQNVVDNNMNYQDQGNMGYQDPMTQNGFDNNMNYQDQGNMGYQDPMAQNGFDNNMNYQDQGNMGYQDPMMQNGFNNNVNQPNQEQNYQSPYKTKKKGNKTIVILAIIIVIVIALIVGAILLMPMFAKKPATNNNTGNQVADIQASYEYYNFYKDYGFDYNSSMWTLNETDKALYNGKYKLIYAQVLENLANSGFDITMANGRSSLFTFLYNQFSSQADANTAVELGTSNFTLKDGSYYAYLDLVYSTSIERCYFVLLPEDDIFIEFILSNEDTIIPDDINSEVLDYVCNVYKLDEQDENDTSNMLNTNNTSNITTNEITNDVTNQTVVNGTITNATENEVLSNEVTNNVDNITADQNTTIPTQNGISVNVSTSGGIVLTPNM